MTNQSDVLWALQLPGETNFLADDGIIHVFTARRCAADFAKTITAKSGAKPLVVKTSREALQTSHGNISTVGHDVRQSETFLHRVILQTPRIHFGYLEGNDVLFIVIRGQEVVSGHVEHPIKDGQYEMAVYETVDSDLSPYCEEIETALAVIANFLANGSCASCGPMCPDCGGKKVA